MRESLNQGVRVQVLHRFIRLSALKTRFSENR